MVDFALFAANKALEKKVSEGEELKTRLEEELKEKVKKMEKELENATVKAAGKHCCENTHTHVLPVLIKLKSAFMRMSLETHNSFIYMCMLCSRHAFYDWRTVGCHVPFSSLHCSDC